MRADIWASLNTSPSRDLTWIPGFSIHPEIVNFGLGFRLSLLGGNLGSPCTV
jgi:hypothetical protein